MICAVKVFLVFLASVCGSGSGMAEAETVKSDLISPYPGLEFLHLGNFGPIARLPSHPTFAHLGLSPHQSIGFINVLLQNGFLNSRALRLANGQPFVGDFYGGHVIPGAFYGVHAPVLDPYIFFLLSNHARYLPYGLGPQGIYGSTGLPKPRPLGILKHSEKN